MAGLPFIPPLPGMATAHPLLYPKLTQGDCRKHWAQQQLHSPQALPEVAAHVADQEMAYKDVPASNCPQTAPVLRSRDVPSPDTQGPKSLSHSIIRSCLLWTLLGHWLIERNMVLVYVHGCVLHFSVMGRIAMLSFLSGFAFGNWYLLIVVA